MLAENLAMLRSLKGLSQEQAAEIAGVARQSYAKWEQGDTLPDVQGVRDSSSLPPTKKGVTS